MRVAGLQGVQQHMAAFGPRWADYRGASPSRGWCFMSCAYKPLCRVCRSDGACVLSCRLSQRGLEICTLAAYRPAAGMFEWWIGSVSHLPPVRPLGCSMSLPGLLCFQRASAVAKARVAALCRGSLALVVGTPARRRSAIISACSLARSMCLAWSWDPTMRR